MRNFKDNEIDLAIVDPPYRDENQPTKDMREKGSMKNLTGRPTKRYFNELNRISKNQIIWGANNFELPQFKGFVVWDKDIPFDFTMSMAELASVSEGLKTISKIVKIRKAGLEEKYHPTQKPVALYKWLLQNYAKPGDKIFDSHVGSGSSRIACYELGFDFIGTELDKDYFEAQEKRFKLEKAKIDNKFYIPEDEKSLFD
jgi:site-specific DNA-methyltransferase (adenine-specific)